MLRNDFFAKPYDATLLTASILKRLGSGNVDSFEQRLKSQKIQYLAQIFGVSPIYPFNLYLRGPYSPDLAHDLFRIKEKNIEVKVDKFIAEDLEDRFNRLNNFIKGKSTRQLELIATLHWLLKIAKLSLIEAKRQLVEIKNVNHVEMKYTIQSVNEFIK